jgi:rod shape-determining protein MreC
MALVDTAQRPGLLLAAAIVLHLVLISVQVTTASGPTIFHALVFGTVSEGQRGIARVGGGVLDVWNGYFALRDVRRENGELRARLDALQVQLQAERAMAERAEAYRALLQMRARVALETTGAEVIAAGASPEFRTVTIDKGTGDQLTTDLAVLAPAGVVGRVVQTGPRAALVQLIVDRSAAAGAVIDGTSVQGVVAGVGDGTLRMDYVPATATVTVGSVVSTSGIDGLYPKGFVLGTIERVTRGDGLYHQIAVRPAVDFSRLEAVLVVLQRQTPPAVGTP